MQPETNRAISTVIFEPSESERFFPRFNGEITPRTCAAAEKSMKETGAQTRLGSWQ